MCSVWVCVPSARPVEHVREWAKAWRDLGYKVVLWRDDFQPDLYPAQGVTNELITIAEYPGYAVATNALIDIVLIKDPECNWVVIGGDDIYPDPNHTADEIAAQCTEHFAERDTKMIGIPDPERRPYAQLVGTFGVMQPTGDRYGEDETGSAYADRVCGSAWLGREFCTRINRGTGPLWHEYTHMFVDEELQQVAIKYCALWQRRDLTHHHEHWARKRADVADRPRWLEAVSGPEHWRKSKFIYESRKSTGFPGSEPR
jgi:hypothetical protein